MFLYDFVVQHAYIPFFTITSLTMPNNDNDIFIFFLIQRWHLLKHNTQIAKMVNISNIYFARNIFRRRLNGMFTIRKI